MKLLTNSKRGGGCTISMGASTESCEIVKTYSDLISEYTLHKKDLLGAGAFGKVYSASDNQTGEVVAVKEVYTRSISTEGLHQLMQEVYIMERLDHPHLVEFIDVFRSRSAIFIVQKLYTGGNLVSRIDQQDRLPEQQVKVIMHQLFSAVEYLHDHGLVHRDLKLDNIMLESQTSDDVVIVDLGCGEDFLPKSGKLWDVVGTLTYTSPEVLTTSYTKACDVWSLGIVMYILLLGVDPYGAFMGASKSTIIDRIKDFYIDPHKDLWRNISKSAKDLVYQILKPEPERLTIPQILRHPWFQTKVPERIRLSNEARDRVKRFKKLRGLRKFKSLVHGVQAVHRFSEGTDISSDSD